MGQGGPAVGRLNTRRKRQHISCPKDKNQGAKGHRNSGAGMDRPQGDPAPPHSPLPLAPAPALPHTHLYTVMGEASLGITNYNNPSFHS